MFFCVIVLGPVVFRLSNYLAKFGITSFPYVTFDQGLGGALLVTGIAFAGGCAMAYYAGGFADQKGDERKGTVG